MDFENYYIGNNEQPYNLIMVTGACRSGKTILSRILGSMQYAEWIEEPYELILLLKCVQVGKADATEKRWMGQIFSGLCKELVNDAILLRNANFRPEDLSTIWRYKEEKEIFQRLVNVNTRSQVERYVKEKGSCFIIDVPEVLNSIGFMKEVYERLQIIHVIRNPYDVAEAVYQKHWYSDLCLQHPQVNDLYRKYYYMEEQAEYYIPWWVEEGCEQDFVRAGEYERGIMYWISQTEWKGYGSGDDKCPELLIKYEDMVQYPQKMLQTFCELGFHPVGKTKMLCDELCSDYISGKNREVHLGWNYSEKFIKVKGIYGYD